MECNKYEGLQINVISEGSMNRNVVVSLALMLLVASFASWVADDGAVLGEKSARRATASMVKASRNKAPAPKGTILDVNQIAEPNQRGVRELNTAQ